MVFAMALVGCEVFDNSGSSEAEKTVLTAKTEMTLEVGESANVDAVVTPEAEITYTTSDDTVATVDENGLVTAVAEGTADITVMADGETVKCVVTVPHVYTYEVTFEKEAYELFVGGEAEVNYTVTADGNEYTLAEGDSVTVTVESAEVATCENNVVTGVAVGNTAITATAVLNGKTVTATAQVNVVASAFIQYSVEGVLSEKVECALGAKIKKPADPTLEGHEFFGWFVEETPFDFDAGITADTVVTAKFGKVAKLVACDEAAVTFDNSWIQGVTSYGYTTEVKAPGEAGSTTVCSDFNDFDGAWCEPKLGNFSFDKYYKIWFSFGFDKATDFSFNTGTSYEQWLTAVPGKIYTCTIQVNENPGHVNIWLTGAGLEGDLWYYNLARTNLNDAALAHVTKVDEVTMYIGAIWGARYPGVIETASIQYSVNGELSEKVAYEVGTKIEKPADPVVAGYEFVGWYVEGVPFNFDAGITVDTVVTAKFGKVTKLVACDEAAVTFENSWIQSLTTYGYTTAVKAPGEAGSTTVSSNFDGAWCEPKLGDFSFDKYYKIWFSFGFDKATNFSFNTGDDSYSNWVTAVPGQIYTCTIQVNENPGRVNVWLTGTGYMEGDLWYYNLEWANLKDRALTHTTKADADAVTMYIGAIWGLSDPEAEEPTVVVEKLVACDEAAVTFENSWIQSVTSYGYTTEVKAPGEAGSTTVCSDFNDFDGAWCEPKLGNFSFDKYYKIWFSFGFDKATDFSFNTGTSYEQWLTAVPGKIYTCTIQVNENPGHVNIWLTGAGLEGDLWYYNLARTNLNDAALAHVTKVDEVTMYIGAIWGEKNPEAEEPTVETVKLVNSDEVAVTFENSWIQSLTTYTYTTDVKFGNEAGSTAVSSNFNKAWCEPKLGDFSFSDYSKIYFSFSFDKETVICFNPYGEATKQNWYRVKAGVTYTCVIEVSGEGLVDIKLIGSDLPDELWYSGLAMSNLKDIPFTHETLEGDAKVTMYIGAIWGEKASK